MNDRLKFILFRAFTNACYSGGIVLFIGSYFVDPHNPSTSNVWKYSLGIAMLAFTLSCIFTKRIPANLKEGDADKIIPKNRKDMIEIGFYILSLGILYFNYLYNYKYTRECICTLLVLLSCALGNYAFNYKKSNKQNKSL